ncbi:MULTISPECIES: DUF6789 family protein [Haloarcula]|uniref:Uncharacterized protein n=1 Tax=Haloarcula pellucida TaxID=1427151 RepID=A0A830GPE5_9EURY|nr:MULTISPECIES: DUF6789 family protein [Halomicroarcula]MBX0349035.1 hypothetical protein [Halomicroarcula pellucida]MDS0279398.1 hypothetical protein [Halomicroarcula sp. S1AR25-4]GGN98687.1 hypothetical protein GCM10009030_29390 [Halomicroarcula pellucida]
MVDTSSGVEDPVNDETVAESEEFDNLRGILADGVVGAAGGLVGTAMMSVVFLIAQSLGAFNLSDFAILTELVGLTGYVPEVLFGYIIFLGGGMFPWPLLFASLKEYLPGKSDPVSGAFFGAAMWTGFVLAFYTGQSGLTLALYAVLTLAAHVVYGIGLGAVFNYFATRPDSIV